MVWWEDGWGGEEVGSAWLPRPARLACISPLSLFPKVHRWVDGSVAGGVSV